MNKFAKIAVVLLFVVVAAFFAVVCSISSRKGSVPPPPPPVPTNSTVQVVASDKKVGESLFVGQVVDASETVKVVCGLDDATAASYPDRASALQTIAFRRDLVPEDIDTLLGFIALEDDRMERSRVVGLKNEVLNLLRNQKKLPPALVTVLVEMITSGEYDDTMTDYCIQHLGMMWRDFVSDEERGKVRKAFETAAGRRRRPYAGTALNSLLCEPSPSEGASRTLRRLTVEITKDVSASDIARTTAFQNAGRYGFTEALPAALDYLAGSRSNVVLAMASVYAVGRLGGPAEVPVLERLRDNGGMRLRPAIDEAIRNLNR